MERIRINLPLQFSFSTILQIRISDLNYGGHVGNDAFLSLVHEARQQYLLHYGYSEFNFAEASLIMLDSAIEYKHELNYGQTIRIHVTATGFDKLGFDIYYLLEVQVGEEWKVAGKVKTGMACFDYKNKKKVGIPSEAISKLSQPA
jgi:acyl-CoA thioesterase FadM